MIQQHINRIRIISFIGMFIFASSLICNPTEIKEFFAPSHLGKIELLHEQNAFYVTQDGIRHTVKKLWMDPILRDMASNTLKKFLANGYIQVNKMSDNEFTLKAKGRLFGGGPIAGAIAYWVTKSICYGGAVAAVGGVTVATGGVAGAAIGGAAATLTLGASAGATIAAGAIAGAGGVATATMATAATVGAAGSIAGAIAAVETASAATGLFFTCIPFLP
jgi:hypothetical protein